MMPIFIIENTSEPQEVELISEVPFFIAIGIVLVVTLSIFSVKLYIRYWQPNQITLVGTQFEDFMESTDSEESTETAESEYAPETVEHELAAGIKLEPGAEFAEGMELEPEFDNSISQQTPLQ